MRFDEFEVTPLETKVLGDLAVYTGRFILSAEDPQPDTPDDMYSSAVGNEIEFEVDF